MLAYLSPLGNEKSGERDGADPGVKLEKEAGQGGTRRVVLSKSRLFPLKKRNIGPFQGAKLTTIFIISNSSRGSTPLFKFHVHTLTLVSPSEG
jgi:hypothetical protein